MKILLLGEFSNVHWTLALALRKIGYQVTLISNRGEWKGYQQDIVLNRNSCSKKDTFSYLFQLIRLLPKCKGYDVVQLIGPASFFDLKIKRLYRLFQYLKKHNNKIFLDAFWTDYYYVKACIEDQRFRYSDFNIGNQKIDHFFNQRSIQDWMHSNMKDYNIRMAKESHGIPTCLYEYHTAYAPYYPKKEQYIPLPIDLSKISPRTPNNDGKIHFFIGIQTSRNALKGTDIMLKALERIQQKYPNQCCIEKVENVPFSTYERLMNASDVLLDQLYSYTPAMNALLAMAKGIVVVGGGEEEHYQLIGEKTLRPIVNVQPNEESVFEQLEQLLLQPEMIKRRSKESIEYVKKHHDAQKIAQSYLDFWSKMPQ
jgi:glycosyltransferase involved in cell wall biosynthesis